MQDNMSYDKKKLVIPKIAFFLIFFCFLQFFHDFLREVGYTNMITKYKNSPYLSKYNKHHFNSSLSLQYK